MTHLHRTARAITWQLTRSNPDAITVLAALPEPRMRYLDAGCDIWEAATHECRRQEQEQLQAKDTGEVWGALLAWHVAYVYTRLALVAPTREAGEMYRSDEIQGELRASVVRLAIGVMMRDWSDE